MAVCLTAAKAAAMTALVAVPVVGAVAAPQSHGSLADRFQSRLQQQLLAHHCTPDTTPDTTTVSAVLRRHAPSALILSPSGEPRLVPLARGRAVGAGRAPGVLLAVCADPVR